jgi:hypothetical protein
MTTEPWVQIGEPRPAFPVAGFFAGPDDLPGLPPDQLAAIRSLDLAERAEEQRHREELAERREMAENRALAESASRSHARGRQWNPSDPWRDYPSHAERVAEAFALQDAHLAAELRQAKAAAARLLREDFGIAAQVVVDSSQPRPQPPDGYLEPAVGEPPPTPGTSVDGASSGSAQRSWRQLGPGEPSYVRQRIARFRARVGRK